MKTKVPFGGSILLCCGLLACGGTSSSITDGFAPFRCGYDAYHSGNLDTDFTSVLDDKGYWNAFFGIRVSGGPVIDKTAGFLNADWPLENWEPVKSESEEEPVVKFNRSRAWRFRGSVSYRVNDAERASVSCTVPRGELAFGSARTLGDIQLIIHELPPWMARTDLGVLASAWLGNLGTKEETTVVTGGAGSGAIYTVSSAVVRAAWPKVESWTETNHSGSPAIRARLSLIDPGRRRVDPEATEARVEAVVTRIVVGETGSKRAALVIVLLTETPLFFEGSLPVFDKLVSLLRFEEPKKLMNDSAGSNL